MRIIWAIVAASGLLQSCATTNEGDTPVKTHYTLEAGQPEVHPSPLPSRTPIYVRWHYNNGTSTSHLGFYGFDFDHDQRFEMVRVLHEDGSVKATVYDFDGDGQVDRTDQKTGGDTQIVTPLSP